MTKILYPLILVLFGLSSYGIDSNKLEFIRLEDSPYLGMFKALVKQGEKQYHLYLGPDNHGALFRQALYEKMGFDIPKLYYKPEWEIEFQKESKRRKFSLKLSRQTGILPRYWREKLDDLHLKINNGILEEVSEKNNWAFYEIPSDIKDDIRNDLALIWSLGDIPEKINLYSTEYFYQAEDRLDFRHHLLFRLGYFRIHERTPMMDFLASLTREDVRQLIAKGEWPEEIQTLLVEKVLARLNLLIETFYPSAWLKHQVNLKINSESVQDGVLTQSRFEGFANEFASKGGRRGILELLRYGVLQGLNAGIDQLEKLTQKWLSVELDEILEDSFPTIKSKVDFSISGGFKLLAARDVIKEEESVSEKPWFIVDQVGIEAKFGALAGPAGLPVDIKAGGEVLIRQLLTHKKPIDSNRDGLLTNWSNIARPKVVQMFRMIRKCKKDSGECYKDLLEALLPGESLSTSIELISTGSLRTEYEIPLPITWLGSVEIGAGAHMRRLVLDEIEFFRTNKGIEVRIHDRLTKERRATFDVKYWFKLIEIEWKKKKLEQESYIYNLYPESDDPLFFEKAEEAVTHLLVNGNRETIEEHFKGVHYSAEVKQKKINFKFFFFLERGRSHAEANIKVYDQEDESEREFGIIRSVRGKGVDFPGVLEISDELMGGIGSPSELGEDVQFAEKLERLEIVTWAELGKGIQPYVQLISQEKKPFLKVSKLKDKIEKNYPLLYEKLDSLNLEIDFKRVNDLTLSKGIWINYPTTKKVINYLYSTSEEESKKFLIYMLGKKRRRICLEKHKLEMEEGEDVCLPAGVRRILKMREEPIPTDEDEFLEWTHKLWKNIYFSANPVSLALWLTENNSFVYEWIQTNYQKNKESPTAFIQSASAGQTDEQIDEMLKVLRKGSSGRGMWH